MKRLVPPPTTQTKTVHRWLVASGVATFVLRIASITVILCGKLTHAQSALGEPEEAIIHYEDSANLTDPVSQLQRRISNGETQLRHEPGRGYLRSLLKELGISSDSQCLLFSKTSSQNEHIGPTTPRAIYYNDQVYVGWVQQGDVIDLVSVDASKGCIFFTLDQTELVPPRITRQSDCIRCHVGHKTSGIPGVLVRSVFTDPDGHPVTQVADFVSGHHSPLNRRWAGWYATGQLENDTHLGNFFLVDRTRPTSFEPPPYQAVADLRDRFNVDPYLTPHSDVVALLVLEHQIGMQNRLVRLNYDARLNADVSGGHGPGGSGLKPYALAADALLEYMLFRNETQLKGRVTGTSGFAAAFQALGPQDRKGRSLRDFDLVHRIFRYPCSYLIYSPAFDALPSDVKAFLWARLEKILSGTDPAFANLSCEDRLAIREILEDTKPDYKAWREANPPASGPGVQNDLGK